MENFDLRSALSVAWGTYVLKKGSVHKTASSVAKAFNLSHQQAKLLEAAMIELAVGIASDPMLKCVAEPISVGEAVDLFAFAVRNEGKQCEWKGHALEADLLEEVIRNYLVKVL